MQNATNVKSADKSAENQRLYQEDPKPRASDFAPEDYNGVLNTWYARQAWRFAQLKRYGVYLYRCQDFLYKMLFHGEYGGNEAWEYQEYEHLLRTVLTWLDVQLLASPYGENANAVKEFRAMSQRLYDTIRNGDRLLKHAFLFFALDRYPALLRSLMNEDPRFGVVIQITNRNALMSWYTSKVRPGAADLLSNTQLPDYVKMLRASYITICGTHDFHNDLKFSELDFYKELGLNELFRNFADAMFTHQEYTYNTWLAQQKMQEVVENSMNGVKDKQEYDENRDQHYRQSKRVRIEEVVEEELDDEAMLEMLDRGSAKRYSQ